MTKDKGKLNNILLGIIIVLLVIIGVMGFFLGKNLGGGSIDNKKGTENVKYEDLNIKIIKDDRDTNADINAFVNSLKELPSLANAKFTIVDFGDTGVKEYMIENDLKTLPAVIFSTKNFDVSKDPVETDYTGRPVPKINEFLSELPSGEYMLEIGARYDPFAERSARGFKLLTQEQYNDLIQEEQFINGNKDAEISWLEYSDLKCSYCAKLHNDETPKKLKEKYGDKLNIIFNHFPIFAPDAAEILECVGSQKGSDAFYSLIEKSFSDKKSDDDYLISEGVKLGANEANLKSCLENKTFTDKINKQMNIGQNLFGINGTPGNIIINNKTYEYQEISGAQPIENFESVIDKLLN